MKLIDAATAIGVGSSVGLDRGTMFSPSKHTVQIVITGAPTAVSVSLEGSVSGSNAFADLTTHVMTSGELTATHAIFHVNDATVNEVRANVTVLTGGTAPTVSVYYLVGA